MLVQQYLAQLGAQVCKIFPSKLSYNPFWGHSKTTYPLKREGVLKKAYENVQEEGGLVRERTYAHVIFKRLLLA